MCAALRKYTRIGHVTRLPTYDPRTVAREIPGVFDSIFPQLTPGVVAHFNQTALRADCEPIPDALVAESQVQKAMLFELGYAVGEALLSERKVDWNACLTIAVQRQRRHFDARIPAEITSVDRDIATRVGRNIDSSMSALAAKRKEGVETAPVIPGLQWLSSGRADFGIGTTLVEIKCSSKNFSAPDYRQLVIYWLLSYAASVETNSKEWKEGILLNPRTAKYVELQFDDFLWVISSGRSKVEILQMFVSTIGTRGRTSET
jgi:hypothetical protein